MDKIILYSCNVGNYDEKINDGRIYIEGVNKFNSDRMNAKMPKILPHLFLPVHDYSIWIDSNIELLVKPIDLVQLMGNYECMVFKHPYRENINQEIEECKKANVDSIQNLEYHGNKEGELAACGIIVRKNTYNVRMHSLSWWGEICRGSVRDQLSFPYTLGRISKYIKTEWEFPFNSKYTKWKKHLR